MLEAGIARRGRRRASADHRHAPRGSPDELDGSRIGSRGLSPLPFRADPRGALEAALGASWDRRSAHEAEAALETLCEANMLLRLNGRLLSLGVAQAALAAWAPAASVTRNPGGGILANPGPAWHAW